MAVDHAATVEIWVAIASISGGVSSAIASVCVIGSSSVRDRASQLHLSQPIRWPPHSPENSTTSTDANAGLTKSTSEGVRDESMGETRQTGFGNTAEAGNSP